MAAGLLAGKNHLGSVTQIQGSPSRAGSQRLHRGYTGGAVIPSAQRYVSAQFEKPVDLETARSAYEGKPGVALMDNPAEGVWPTPLDSTNGDTCYVGRMRMDMAIDNALTLWVVGDQVRKGAALNAVQIAELLVTR